MKQIRVRTRIVFEVEYSLEMEFYETEDEVEALEIERAGVAGGPIEIIDAFGARCMGTFTTSVEQVNR